MQIKQKGGKEEIKGVRWRRERKETGRSQRPWNLQTGEDIHTRSAPRSFTFWILPLLQQSDSQSAAPTPATSVSPGNFVKKADSLIPHPEVEILRLGYSHLCCPGPPVDCGAHTSLRMAAACFFVASHSLQKEPCVWHGRYQGTQLPVSSVSKRDRGWWADTIYSGQKTGFMSETHPGRQNPLVHIALFSWLRLTWRGDNAQAPYLSSSGLNRASEVEHQDV